MSVSAAGAAAAAPASAEAPAAGADEEEDVGEKAREPIGYEIMTIGGLRVKAALALIELAANPQSRQVETVGADRIDASIYP